MSSERVTVQEYDTVDEAKDAEKLLLESGLTKDIVSRAGKSIRVVAKWEDEARSVLGSSTIGAASTGGSTIGDILQDTDPVVATDLMDASGASTVEVTDVVITPMPETYFEESTLTASSVDTGAGTDSSVTDKVSGAASSMTDTVTSAASSATDTVTSAASSATDAVQQAAGTVADKVQSATSGVTSQVDKASEAAADKVDSLADTVREKGSSPDASGVQQQAVEVTAVTLEKTAHYLREGNINAVLADVRTLVQRYPVRSLLAGFGIGYAARMVLLPSSGGQSQSSTEGSASTQQPATGTTSATQADFTVDTGSYDAAYGASTVPSTTVVGVSAETTFVDVDVPVVDVTTPYVESTTGGTADQPELYGSGVGTVNDVTRVDDLTLAVDDTRSGTTTETFDMDDTTPDPTAPRTGV